MIERWTKLLEQFRVGDVDQTEISLFLAEMEVFKTNTLITNVLAETTWRDEAAQLHRRQTVAQERIAELLEKIANG